MTQKNKLIVGGVVVLALAYYLYDRNKKMKAVADLKAGAEVTPAPEVAPSPAPTIVKSTATIGEQKELNFAGSNRKGISAQYFR